MDVQDFRRGETFALRSRQADFMAFTLVASNMSTICTSIPRNFGPGRRKCMSVQGNVILKYQKLTFGPIDSLNLICIPTNSLLPATNPSRLHMPCERLTPDTSSSPGPRRFDPPGSYTCALLLQTRPAGRTLFPVISILPLPYERSRERCPT